MKVVLDTNVIVSGFGWPEGVPGQIIQHWKDGDFEVVVTAEIMAEYHEVLFDLAKEHARFNYHNTIAMLGRRSDWVIAAPLMRQICTDPTDDIFIAAALGGNVDAIVTGDKALLRAHVPEVKILRPVEFLNWMSRGTQEG